MSISKNNDVKKIILPPEIIPPVSTIVETEDFFPEEEVKRLRMPSKKKKYSSKKEGTGKQESLSNEEIQRNLLGYKKLSDLSEEEIAALPKGTHIRYFTAEGKFRYGGVLIVNNAPRIFRLKGFFGYNSFWAIDLKKNFIFFKDKDLAVEEKKTMDDLFYQLQKKEIAIIPRDSIWFSEKFRSEMEKVYTQLQNKELILLTKEHYQQIGCSSEKLPEKN